MKLFLFFIITILSTNAFSVDYSKNPIYHAIVTLHKDIDRVEALKYSNIISKYSKKYRIDPFLLVSISRQESYLNLKATRQQGEEQIIYNKVSGTFTKQVEVTDFCMMQINKANVIWKKLDPARLLKDADYCIHEGVKILVYFQPLSATDVYWWTRYNSAKEEARSIYKGYVLGHYNKIAQKIPNLERVRQFYTGSDLTVAMDGDLE